MTKQKPLAQPDRPQFLRIAALTITLLFIPALSEAATLQDLVAEQNLDVHKLKVTAVGDILIIRGQVHGQNDFVRIGRMANEIGYPRVANLVEIVPFPDDEAIERAVEREFGMSRSLEGCKFSSIESTQGIVRITGSVKHDVQRDIARLMATEVEGVKEVEFLAEARDSGR